MWPYRAVDYRIGAELTDTLGVQAMSGEDENPGNLQRANTFLSPAQLREIEKLAAQRQVRVSVVIRDAVRFYLSALPEVAA